MIYFSQPKIPFKFLFVKVVYRWFIDSPADQSHLKNPAPGRFHQILNRHPLDFSHRTSVY